MVPRTPVLPGSERITETVLRSNGTLRHAIDTVHRCCQKLSNSVPMDAGAIIFQLIFNDDCDILLILLAKSTGLKEKASERCCSAANSHIRRPNRPESTDQGKSH